MNPPVPMDKPVDFARLTARGDRLRRAGKWDAAIEVYRAVAGHVEDDVAALFGWAQIAAARGNLDNAGMLLAKLLKKDPAHVPARTLVGIVYARQGWPLWARQCFETALDHDPDHIPAIVNLALLLIEQGEAAEAEKLCARSLARNPGNLPLAAARARALQGLGRTKEAIATLADALRRGARRASIRAHHKGGAAVEDDFARHACELARMQIGVGDLAAARRGLRRLIKYYPAAAEAYGLLIPLHGFRRDDPLIAAMRRLLRRRRLPAEDRITLYFSLAAALEKTGDTADAFAQYRKANALVRAGFEYGPSVIARVFADTKALFAGMSPRRALRPRPDDPVPIFIVGMPRSGTTLAEQILSRHPKVRTLGEVPWMQKLAYGHYRLWDEARYGGHIDNVPRDILRAMRNDYAAACRNAAEGAAFVTDKMPLNFFYIGLIRLLFPQAKIIHCRRAPLDTCVSIYRQRFQGFFPFAYDLTELGLYYRGYEGLMAFWQNLLPGFIHELCYEDLVSAPEENVRALLEFCGLRWHAPCIEFHKSEHAVMTASAVQVRRRLNRRGIDSHQKYARQLSSLRRALEGVVPEEEAR